MTGKIGWKEPAIVLAAITLGVAVVAFGRDLLGFEFSPEPEPSPTAALALSSPPTSPSQSPSPSPSSEPNVSRQETGVLLPYSYALDLDTTATNWDVENASVYKNGDIYYATTARMIQTRADIAIVSGDPSYRACEDSMDRRDRAISRDDVVVGLTFCVRTSEQKWAWLKLTKFDRGKSMTYDITVW
ncbi:hypothetical protein [Actinoplanes subglobosus]|uniref:Uncharacterized protein n=1 Tax=Actinoplanes subglobosus TaxID=1547892 RepID=A0ABV8IWS5_9ACTN